MTEVTGQSEDKKLLVGLLPAKPPAISCPDPDDDSKALFLSVKLSKRTRAACVDKEKPPQETPPVHRTSKWDGRRQKWDGRRQKWDGRRQKWDIIMGQT